MTSREAWSTWLGTGALALGAMALCWAVVDAVRIGRPDTPPTVEAAGQSTPGLRGGPAVASPADARVASDARAETGGIVRGTAAAAIARNPFSRTRRAPPWDVATGDVAPDDAAHATGVDGAVPQVLGTAVAEDGSSFAMCRLGGGPATVVRVGERLGVYTVLAITRGRVTFRDAAGVRLDVATPDAPPGVQP